jgi:1-acyl-sn-glycerol-3-phosphate acyltransferase
MAQTAPRHRGLLRIIQAGLHWLSRAYFRLDVEGAARIPAEGGALIAGNHPSVLDGILLWAASPRPVRFLIAEDLYRHRFLKPLFEALGCIEVLRTRPGNGDALRAAAAALERGELIGIFPEGTIHFRGAMRQVKQGVALLALKTGCPVIPMAIRGSGEAFPDGSRVPRPRPVRMRFGAPVAYPKAAQDPIPAEDVARTLEAIRRRIVETMRAAEAPARAGRGRLLEFRAALAACVICPLAALLTCTANPSLDPARQRP